MFRMTPRSVNERIYGLVYDKHQDILQGLTGRVVKRIEVSYLEDYFEILSFDISAGLEKQMYIYYRSTGDIELANYNDIRTYMTNGDDASRIFLQIYFGEVRGLVIIRD